MIKGGLKYLAAASVCAIICSTQAFAQIDASGTGVSTSDIVVTAQKRNESAQDVPISLTALSGDTLAKSGVASVVDIPRVAPSFYIYRGPQAANTQLSIRGIGSSGNSALEPSVGAFVDGIYVPRPGPLLAGLNDIASVEVLRGPQGTLFGRNASVGAISFHTTEPKDDFGGSVSAEYGNFDRLRLNGIVNAPLSEGVAARISAAYDRYDGYGRNDMTGNRFGSNRTLSLRGALRADIAPNLRWLLRGDYQQQRGDGLAVNSVLASSVTPAAAANWNTRLNGLVPKLTDTYSYRLRQVTGGDLQDDQWGVSSDLGLDIGDYSLRLLSGYRKWDDKQYEDDASRTAANLYGVASHYRSKSFSHELQIVSPKDLLNDHLSFVAGLYYYRENYLIGQRNDLNPNFCDVFIARARPALLAACRSGPQVSATNNVFEQVTKSYAAYGQATLKLSDMWDVTGGLRYSHDDKDGDVTARLLNSAAAGLSVNDTARDLRFKKGRVTYRLNTTFRPTRDVMLFATLSTGFKSGGFDANFVTVLGQNRVFAPETTTNYELGIKSEFLDHKVTANASLFRMDVKDFQLRSYNGAGFSVQNAGSIRQQGVEFELSYRPVRDLTLALNGTRLDSEFTDFRNAPGLPAFGGVQDLTGARAPYSPKWQGSMSADYRTDVGGDFAIGFNTRLSFLSDINVGAGGDNNPQGIQPGYALLGGRLTLYGPDDRFEFALAGDNLTGKGYCSVIYPQPQGGAFGLADPVGGGTVQRCALGEPRTIRASAKWRF